MSQCCCWREALTCQLIFLRLFFYICLEGQILQRCLWVSQIRIEQNPNIYTDTVFLFPYKTWPPGAEHTAHIASVMTPRVMVWSVSLTVTVEPCVKEAANELLLHLRQKSDNKLHVYVLAYKNTGLYKLFMHNFSVCGFLFPSNVCICRNRVICCKVMNASVQINVNVAWNVLARGVFIALCSRVRICILLHMSHSHLSVLYV